MFRQLQSLQIKSLQLAKKLKNILYVNFQHRFTRAEKSFLKKEKTEREREFLSNGFHRWLHTPEYAYARTVYALCIVARDNADDFISIVVFILLSSFPCAVVSRGKAPKGSRAVISMLQDLTEILISTRTQSLSFKYRHESSKRVFLNRMLFIWNTYCLIKEEMSAICCCVRNFKIFVTR